MIRIDDVFVIGRITKHRGLRGEVEMNYIDDSFDTGSSDYLVLDIDGILVPFFWEEYRFKNDGTVILKFEGIDNEREARSIVNHEVYYPLKYSPVYSGDATEGVLASYKALTGFTVYDTTGTVIGTIARVDDSSRNILLEILTPNEKELLLPFHDDFLRHFDLRKRSLTLEIPEGLLTLND